MSGPAEHEPQPVRQDGDPAQVEVFPFVHKDLLEREAYGRREYNGPLVTCDGRANKWDAYQEALDLVVYLRKDIMEEEQREWAVGALRAQLEAVVRQRDTLSRGLAELNRKLTQERNNTGLVQERLDNAQEILATQRAVIAEYKDRE